MTLPNHIFSRQNDATSHARTTKHLLHLLSSGPLGRPDTQAIFVLESKDLYENY